jgi:hypothetical protein
MLSPNNYDTQQHLQAHDQVARFLQRAVEDVPAAPTHKTKEHTHFQGKDFALRIKNSLIGDSADSFTLAQTAETPTGFVEKLTLNTKDEQVALRSTGEATAQTYSFKQLQKRFPKLLESLNSIYEEFSATAQESTLALNPADCSPIAASAKIETPQLPPVAALQPVVEETALTKVASPPPLAMVELHDGIPLDEQPLTAFNPDLKKAIESLKNTHQPKWKTLGKAIQYKALGKGSNYTKDYQRLASLLINVAEAPGYLEQENTMYFKDSESSSAGYLDMRKPEWWLHHCKGNEGVEINLTPKGESYSNVTFTPAWRGLTPKQFSHYFPQVHPAMEAFIQAAKSKHEHDLLLNHMVSTENLSTEEHQRLQAALDQIAHATQWKTSFPLPITARDISDFLKVFATTPFETVAATSSEHRPYKSKDGTLLAEIKENAQKEYLLLKVNTTEGDSTNDVILPLIKSLELFENGFANASFKFDKESPVFSDYTGLKNLPRFEEVLTLMKQMFR